MSPGDIIQDITLSAEDNATYSISDKQATRLAQLGDAIRRLFGFECDVEWVLDKEVSLKGDRIEYKLILY